VSGARSAQLGVLAALLAVALSAAPAGAVSSVSPAARGLAHNRLYVSPAVAETIDAKTRARLGFQLPRRRESIFVALVAFAPGDAFDADGDRFLTALAGRTQRPGIYVTYDPRGLLLTLGYRTSHDDADRAAQAARVVDSEAHFADDPPGPRLESFLGALDDPDLAGRELRADAAFRERIGEPPLSTDKGGDSGGGISSRLLVLLGAVAVLLAVVAVLLVRRRRARPVDDRPVLPERVFALAREASRDELAARADAALIDLSARMDAAPPSQNVERALAAYEAAERVLAREPDVPDLVGALVCIDLGRESLDGAPALAPPCTYDPRHGPARGRPVEVAGTALRLCDACRADVRASRPAAVLRDGNGRPYFEDDSPWAKSGYGAWSDPIRAVLDRP
jgi:hypothetical protein